MGGVSIYQFSLLNSVMSGMPPQFANPVLSALGQYSEVELDTRLERSYAEEGSQFWLHSGSPLYSLDDLCQALHEMPQELYNYHVSKEKNDFANWVQYVLHDNDCASDLRRCKKPLSARRVVIKHLKKYK